MFDVCSDSELLHEKFICTNSNMDNNKDNLRNFKHVCIIGLFKLAICCIVFVITRNYVPLVFILTEQLYTLGFDWISFSEFLM